MFLDLSCTMTGMDVIRAVQLSPAERDKLRTLQRANHEAAAKLSEFLVSVEEKYAPPTFRTTMAVLDDPEDPEDEKAKGTVHLLFSRK